MLAVCEHIPASRSLPNKGQFPHPNLLHLYHSFCVGTALLQPEKARILLPTRIYAFDNNFL